MLMRMLVYGCTCNSPLFIVLPIIVDHFLVTTSRGAAGPCVQFYIYLPLLNMSLVTITTQYESKVNREREFCYECTRLIKHPNFSYFELHYFCIILTLITLTPMSIFKSSQITTYSILTSLFQVQLLRGFEMSSYQRNSKHISRYLLGLSSLCRHTISSHTGQNNSIDYYRTSYFFMHNYTRIYVFI